MLPQPLIRWALERAAPGSYGFAIARTRCFDDALLAEAADGIQQVVILGAGYDSPCAALRQRAQGRARVRGRPSRHAGAQDEHPAALQSSTFPRTSITSPSISTATRSKPSSPRRASRAAAARCSCGKASPTTSRKPVVAGILRFVESCAPGSSIVFDYALRTFVDGDTSTYGGEHIARLAAQDRRALRVRPEPARDAALPRRMRLEAGLRHRAPRTPKARYLAAQGRRHPRAARSATYASCTPATSNRRVN